MNFNRIKRFSIIVVVFSILIKFLNINCLLQYCVESLPIQNNEIIFIFLISCLIGIFNIKLLLYTALEIIFLILYTFLLIYSPKIGVLMSISLFGGMTGGYIGKYYYEKLQHKADMINLNKEN